MVRLSGNSVYLRQTYLVQFLVGERKDPKDRKNKTKHFKFQLKGPKSRLIFHKGRNSSKMFAIQRIHPFVELTKM